MSHARAPGPCTRHDLRALRRVGDRGAPGGPRRRARRGRPWTTGAVVVTSSAPLDRARRGGRRGGSRLRAGLVTATEVAARHHGHDLRVVREPDRAQAQQARRRHRDVNYATEKARVSFADPVTDRRPARGRLGRRVRRGAAGHRGRAGASVTGDVPDPELDRPAAAAGRLRAALRPGRAAVDGARPAVRRLAVGVAHPGDAGRGLGSLAVPPGRVGEPAARRDHDGHARLAGCAGGVRLVAGRAVLRDRRRDRDDPRVRARRWSAATVSTRSTSRSPRA